MADPAMLSPPLAVLLGALIALATGYCAVRCYRPACHGHGRGLAAWHTLMGLAMIAMLLVPLAALVALVLLAVFLAGGVRMLIDAGTRAHLRAAVCSVVMAAMLAPAAFAGSASAAPAHPMTGSHAGAGPATSMPPVWLAAAVVILAAAIVVAAAASGLRARRPEGRLRAACEVVMAGAMGVMGAVAL